MNNTIKFSVDAKNDGKRLDIFLTEKMDQFTRSFLKKLIDNKQVKINDKVILSPSTKVRYRDQIIANILERKNLNLIPKKN